MVRVLKPKGKLIIITDNAGYFLYHNFDKTHYGKYETRTRYGSDDRHYSLFTTHHLVNHLEDCKLKRIKVKYCTYLVESPLSLRIKTTLTGKIFPAVFPFKKMRYPRVIITGIK